MENKEIEIPFGAKDSELIESTYHIPDGMEAIIEGDRVIIRKKGSEDEKTRKEIYRYLYNELHYIDQLTPRTNTLEMWLAWLEKQSKENMIEALRLEYEKGKSDVLQEQRKEWSEEDEKIIKALKEGFKYYQLFNPTFGGISCIEIVNWLERQNKQHCNISPIDNFTTEFEKQVSYLIASSINKENDYTADYVKWAANALLNYAKKELENQCEQKPIDIIEPKFKVGDFIVNDYCMGRVVELTNDAYLLDTEQGIPFSYEHNVHLWSINDAKDGDIIYIKRYKNNSEWLLIFKKIESLNNFIDIYDYYAFCITSDNTYHESIGNGCWGLLGNNCDIVCPATKEQCNLLFAKMKEEGYKWDAEKKDLKKISQEYPLTPDECTKPAWSEEDEKNLQGIVDEIQANKNNAPDYDIETYDRFLNWLKSLKERIGE